MEKALSPELLNWIHAQKLAAYDPRNSQVIKIGASMRDQPLYAHVWIHNPHNIPEQDLPSIVAWAFPHPDEPLGFWALTNLAHGLDQKLEFLPEGKWYLALDPDPDLRMYNQDIFSFTSLSDYLTKTFKPQYIGHDLDYAFPIDHEILWLPEWYQGTHACLEGLCEHDICPPTSFGALPESAALVKLMQLAQPDLVLSMHNAYASGDYHYLLKKPSSKVLEDLKHICELFKRPVHLGEPEQGRRWQPRAHPEAIREPTLAQKMKSLAHLDPQEKYLISVSASMWLEKNFPQADFFVPETGQFTSPDFADISLSPETRHLQGETYITREGKNRIALRGVYQLPEGQKQEVLYAMLTEDHKQLLGSHSHALTRGMAGVEAITLRRWAWNIADEIWHSLPEEIRLSRDLYALDRSRIQIPGSRVNDQPMRWYRTNPDFALRPITVAQQTDYEVRFKIRTLMSIGNLYAFCKRQNCNVQAERAHDLLEMILTTLPEKYHQVYNQTTSMQSQLARSLYMASNLKMT